MHITSDVSIGALISWAITLAGVFIVFGKTMQLLDVLTKDVSKLKLDTSEQTKEFNRRFETIQASLAEAAVKNATIAATLTATVTTLTTLVAQRQMAIPMSVAPPHICSNHNATIKFKCTT